MFNQNEMGAHNQGGAGRGSGGKATSVKGRLDGDLLASHSFLAL